MKKRQGLLDGVCITGGEPTLQPQLLPLLSRIKALGYAVKLDTNGSRPDVLRTVAENNLVDYVAMDIKNSPAMYAATTGIPDIDLGDVEKSIQYLVSSSLPYEFRTTLVHPLHSDNSILEMGKWLSSLVPEKKPEKLFLQRFQDRDTVVFAGFHIFLKGYDSSTIAGVVYLQWIKQQDILRWQALLSPYVQDVVIRSR